MPYSKMRLIVSFLAAVLVTFTAASIMHSQFVLAGLIDLGVEISLMTRLSYTASDWLGLLPGYGTVVLISLLLGFCAIGVGRRLFDWSTRWSFIIGGAIAFCTMLLAMHPLLNITLIAGSRGTWGFICQCLAGAAGGYLFSLGVEWSRLSTPTSAIQ